MNSGRREFLLRFCQGVGATLIPKALWGGRFGSPDFSVPANDSDYPTLYVHPHYRSDRPLDSVLLKAAAGNDAFVTEKYADDLEVMLRQWSASLLQSPRDVSALSSRMTPTFAGAAFEPKESRVIRAAPPIEVRSNTFRSETTLNRNSFLHAWQNWLRPFAKVDVAEFQITRIDADSNSSTDLQTVIRYEIAGSGDGFHREQRVGNWALHWERAAGSDFQITSWRVLDEQHARTSSPIFADVTAAALGSNSSYATQLLHGTDYWRTIIDGAAGIDIYGHNGVSVADIDNDGYDDLYICQPAGLPNRLYRNRGDGTFEDITEYSGLGLLENTVCALFADFNNDGLQDVILVRIDGPLLFINEGNGKFREHPDSFQFATPPQGSFTGAAVADYDRDGWLDIYFCLYSYYQGTGQYRYPLPYHDANNGPPNFLMRNQRNGTFHDVTADAGLDKNNTRYSFCCGWSDYNRDGWPDLYVVNDFGRKNLYRNNGDGTFTDVAAALGVEDVGAGMSACWFDHNNDGAEDLYVANMWTAAGLRVAMQDIFKKGSPAKVRELFQKHAMGNSLLTNRGAKFEDSTQPSGTGMGRWAWSGDAIDFDHDGFPDLYVVNGMVSGESHSDLNSFFWRQVVANSPDNAASNKDYEQGWNAVNELIRADGTWSGYERNVFYANNRDGTFSDISAAAGLDFLEDGRSFSVCDIDQDGRLEIILKSRSAPQLRVLKNVVEDLPPSISFRLKGTKSNRDAIGAAITIEAGGVKQTRTMQAGSAFLSQHSKDVHFGLGAANGPVHAAIHWPSGQVQQLNDLPANHRIWVEEGAVPSRIEAFRHTGTLRPSSPAAAGEPLREKVETWLLAPVPAPDFALPDLAGQMHALTSARGNITLLTFWTTMSTDYQQHLAALEKKHLSWSAQGLRVFAINVDSSTGASSPEEEQIKENGMLEFLAAEHRFSFALIRGSQDIAAIYNILFRQLFDRHRDMPLPTSFLVNADGRIVKVYQGTIDADHVDHDFRHIPSTDAERLARALPFPSATYGLEFGRNHLSSGALFFQRGYLEQAEVSFQQALQDDPDSAEALYGIGSVYLNQNKNAEARQVFERCLKLKANYPETLPDAWNNLGVLATREGNVAQAIENFQQALKINPNHLLSLQNLGNAYRLQKQWADAREMLERALAVSPQDPEANYSLGMVFAQTDDTAKAYDYLQRALKARPVYPEALNNLGILFLVTHRRDDAVASFQQCIRVAPAFDQAYLNLARVYALENSRDKARQVLSDLLQKRPNHPQAEQMLQKLQQ